MKNKNTIFIVVTAVLVIGITAVIIFMSNRNDSQSSMQGMNHGSMSDNTASETPESATYKKYAALKGEEYDKAFVGDMIVHHEGAINMAEAAMAGARRQEVKDLASSIGSSQGPEVFTMQSWQKEWGYPISSGHSMQGGSAESMQGMASMGAELQGLSGEEFDKKFLELMIQHHQDAIDMSKPADMNAKHQEVKDLAKAVISAQSAEIEKMKQWQKEWGY